MNGVKTQHPAFGLITVTRCTVGAEGAYAFGSDARHTHLVHVQINTAEIERDLSHNWLHQDKRIIEFWMTESQWARFVSAFGNGSGTPVTLRYYDGDFIDECPPPENFKSQFADEVKKTVNSAVSDLKSWVARIKEVLMPGNKPMGKKELAEALKGIESAMMHVSSSLPYIEKCFNEKMDKASTEAKIEFEAVVNGRLREMGLESARNQLTLPTENNFHDEGNATNHLLSQCDESCKG